MTIAVLRQQGQVVDVLHLKPAPRWREAANIALGIPHYRTRFATPENRRIVQAAYSGQDVTVVSWEPLDVLGSCLPPPVILIAHNITSLALPQLFPESWLARRAARQAAVWERQLYRSARFAAIATLSNRDRDYLAGLGDAPPILLIVPGMPPLLPLSPTAELRREIVLSGTYNWWPKRRDVVRFAKEYALERERMPVFASRLPPPAAMALSTAPALSNAEASRAIRFGLITDRFEAGHKLKTLAHIAHNQVVLSFSDTGREIADVPDHEFFIRRLTSTGDISREVAAVSASEPYSLRERLLRFQKRCADRFSWENVGIRLTHVAQQAIESAQARYSEPR
jgi:hypothetical protein